MCRKSENSSRTSALAATLVGLMFLSCSPSSPSDPGQTQGQIQVNVSTSGTGAPSSFTVTLGGGSSRSIPPDGSVTFGSLNPGNYTVELDVPGNCTISGSAERSVGVQENSTSTVAYSVSCSAVPTGAIGVTTSTTGSPADPDGYTVAVDGGAARAIGVNDNLLVPDVGLGDHEVELSGVADNCLVQGANPRTVSVAENQTTPTEFEVVCSATTGRIDVTVTTTGAGLDPDGYPVDLDAGAVTRPVDANGSVEFTGVEQGEHTLTLEDVASNCTVTGDNPVSVEVVAGAAVAASFTVECEATTGSLQVSVTTTGDAIDADGYSVVLDGGVSTQLVDPNDTVVFAGLAPGQHTVALQNVAENCTVTSTNPATADVTAGQQADVAFTVACEELTGSIQVNVSTTGDELDSDGYSVSLDGGSGLSVTINGSRTFTGVVIGEHQIEIGGVASNCGVQGANPRTVTVNEDATTQVDFAVECSATAGQIEVTVTTTGDDLDPNGYTVDLDGSSSEAIATNGTTTFTGVSEGSHTLTLQNIAMNCTVTSSNPTSTNVTAGQTSNVGFTVECTRTTGDIRVTTSTTGSPADPDGYTVSVDGGAERAIGNTDEEFFLDLQPGEHTVTLGDVALNCSVVGGEVRTVQVNADEETLVAYSIECVPLVGDLRVNVSTTGEDLDPDGYTVLLDGGSGQSVATNGSTTFTDVATGSHEVMLTGIASNCSVVGDNPKTAIVEFAITVDVDFDVTCVGQTGDLTVNTSTTGVERDPDGYTVTVDGGSARSIGINDTETYVGLADGVHSVFLDGVADNCTVSSANPRNVNVPPDGTVSTTFDVTCEATTGSIAVDVSTSGDDQDSDGYTITLDGGNARSVGINGSTTYSDLAPGDYDIGISGVASNCTVAETNPQTASVTAGSTTNVSFTVTCQGLTGDLTVTTSTTGDELDDGYTVTVDGGSARSIGINDTETYLDVADGDHTVELTDVASNCTVSGSNPRTVSVPAGGTGSTTFDVACEATTGSIEVTTTSTGTNLDSDGYTVDLDGVEQMSILANDTVTFTEVAEGGHTLTLSGQAANCTITSENPTDTTVTAGNTATVGFTIECI